MFEREIKKIMFITNGYKFFKNFSLDRIFIFHSILVSKLSSKSFIEYFFLFNSITLFKDSIMCMYI